MTIKEKHLASIMKSVFYYSGNITYNEEFYDMSGSGYDRYASTVSAWHDGKMNGIASTSFPRNPIKFLLHSSFI